MNVEESTHLVVRLLPRTSRRRLGMIAASLGAALGMWDGAAYIADARKKKKKKNGNKKKPPVPPTGCTPACTGMRTCVNGVCTLGCGPEMADCPREDFCVDLATDALNCGACGRSCSGGDVCLDGVCGCLPPSVDLSTVLQRARPGATVRLCAGTWDLPGTLELPSVLHALVGAGKGDGGSTLRGKAMRRAVVSLNGSIITLKNLRITHSTSDDRETVYNEGTLTLDNVAIEDTGWVAVYNRRQLYMDQCEILRSARTGLYSSGVASAQISRSRISGNAQGVENYGDLTLQDSEVSENHVPIDRVLSGGGIYNNSGDVTLTGVTVIRRNSADWGAGISNGSGMISIGASCEITGNTAHGNGGGISNYEGTVTLATGAKITGNTAQSGGGIINRNGSITGDTSGVTGNTPDDFCEFDDATWSCL